MSFQVTPFSPARQIGADWLELGKRKHHIAALSELDVTAAREAIRKLREESGERVSFFAWLVKCIAQAVSEHKEVNAYRGRKGVVVFDDVDVSIIVEKTVAGAKIPVPYVVRAANTKTQAEIQAEVRAAQAQDLSGGYQVLGQERNPFMAWVSVIPPFIRQLIWRAELNDPWRAKRTMGTVVVTSLMSSRGIKGWAIPIGTHTVCFALGSVVKKPGVVEDRIEIREYLNLTLMIDHDLVDGMPAVRLLSRLTDLVEGGFGLV
jgi:pyruvate/2-oxoglutarate dehydrogenase complex dihydrolipoamide acyltransferase (E2) component